MQKKPPENGTFHSDRDWHTDNVEKLVFGYGENDTYMESMGDTLCKRFVMKFICSKCVCGSIDKISFESRNRMNVTVYRTKAKMVSVGNAVLFFGFVNFNVLICTLMSLTLRPLIRASTFVSFYAGGLSGSGGVSLPLLLVLSIVTN